MVIGLRVIGFRGFRGFRVLEFWIVGFFGVLALRPSRPESFSVSDVRPLDLVFFRGFTVLGFRISSFRFGVGGSGYEVWGLIRVENSKLSEDCRKAEGKEGSQGRTAGLP